MTCLVHNPRYRSLFHAVVNELRNEKRTPVPMLRNMPNKCCTCNNTDKLTLISVLIHDQNNLKNLQNLINQINRDKKTNPKLVLSLNRLENFIKENRDSTPIPSTVDIDVDETHYSFSESDGDAPMNIRKRISRKQKKRTRPLKNGIFLFLSYKCEDIPKSDTKKLQRGRFLGRNKYIVFIEKQHDVRINMITATTTEQIKLTLTNAKAGIGNVKIHKQEDLKEGEDGEWILIRQKKSKDPTTPTDFEAVLNELKKRWDSFLNVKKRKIEIDDDEYPNKK
jgi:hypothetical protein